MANTFASTVKFKYPEKEEAAPHGAAPSGYNLNRILVSRVLDDVRVRIHFIFVHRKYALVE